MQLAILLSLIHTRGSSLPDKRTALYDSYVALFLDRESEKSEVVRMHRDILIDIHRYLAWILHLEAERGKNQGSIGEEHLKRVLSEYLRSEERDTSLVDALFSGLIERIVFLVSRVQGTFEFEVQPLREYFAARHLYETAPYSPPGAEKSGTKPDRLDAMAKNFYWLNATRFYAGCYSKGELPGLTSQLRELADSEGYRFTGYPARLAAMLLSDWVFSQHRPSTLEAIRLVIEHLKTALPYGGRSSYVRATTDGELVLPSGCGREELVDHGFCELRRVPPSDYAGEITELLLANAGEEELDTRWLSELLASAENRKTYWFKIGLALGSLSYLVPVQK